MSVLNALRQKALDLPFDAVSEIQTFEGADADYNNATDPALRWLLCRGGGYTPSTMLYDRRGYKVNLSFSIAPTRQSVFSIDVGEGCESLEIGFAEYPAKLVQEDYSLYRYQWDKSWRPYTYKVPNHRGKWSSFCKTEYAYNQGPAHFLRCHLAIVALLDHAKAMKVLKRVHDEGEFWETRSIQTLFQSIGESHAMIAAVHSALQQMGTPMESPVQSDPNYLSLAEEGRLNSPILRKLVEAVGTAA